MQIGSANLLALQQAQPKPQTQETGDFAAALAAEPGQDFAPLFPENTDAQAAMPEGAGQPASQPGKPAAAATPQFPGSQLDIKV
jgi:hypothetical protein